MAELASIARPYAQAVFELARIANYAAAPNNHIRPNICPMPDLTVISDNCWPFNTRTVLHDCALSQINPFAYNCLRRY